MNFLTKMSVTKFVLLEVMTVLCFLVLRVVIDKNVEAMYVPANLVQWYRDSSFWSMVSDDKIMVLP